MKILLTGATGFLGYRTLEKLIELPNVHSILATGRNLPDYRKVNHDKITYCLGDLRDKAFVDQICRDIDVVVNTASLSSPWGKRQEFIEANIHTQLNLIESAKKNRVSHFVYISSPSIYYNGKDRWNVKESDLLPKTFVNEYARTKYEAEQILVQNFESYVILRPRALIGRGDSIIMPRLINAFDQGRLKVIGDGNNIVDLTSVCNAADAIALSLFPCEAALNQAYNITNGDPVNLWQCVASVLNQLNRELNSKKVPFMLIDNVARFLEIKAKLTDDKEPAITRYGVGTLAKNFTLDISKARTYLGYNPAVDTNAAVDEFINWYTKHENL
jgi:2-alkyl-3-oxoalkanoate reductase